MLEKKIGQLFTVTATLALTLCSSICVQASFAQFDFSMPSGAANQTDTTWQNALPQASQGAPDAGLGQTYVSGTQGAGQQGGPKLQGTPSGGGGGGAGAPSGAATSAPFRGSYRAPGNFTLQWQGRFGQNLPPTRLDSFVKESGYADDIYGDEGTEGPPPLNNFKYIESGIKSDGLTTDHRSQLPSAWGTPQ
jgi:hypothetical protein